MTSSSVSVQVLRSALIESAVAWGCSERVARQLAEHYLWAEVRGYVTHGLDRFLRERSDFPWDPRGSRRPRIRGLAGSVAYVDGDGTVGAWAAHRAAGLTASLAKRNGYGVVVLSNALRFAALGEPAEQMAKEVGMGMVMASTPVEAGVEGVAGPLLGVNPMAYSFMDWAGPYTVDFSSTQHAMGVMYMAREERKGLPLRSFLDSRGRFVVDPQSASVGAVFGGHKGFAVALLVELLCGSVVGQSMGAGKADAQDCASIFVAIRPSDVRAFSDANSQFLASLNTLFATADGVVSHVPGHRARERARLTEVVGRVAVASHVLDNLARLPRGREE